MTVWLATIVLNLSLCFLLLFRGWYRRYPWLLLSLIWQVFAASILHHIYTTSGTHSMAYLHVWTFKNFMDVAFNLGKALEGKVNRNLWVEYPSAGYALLLITMLVCRKVEAFDTAHIFTVILQWSSILMLTLWVYLFKNEANYGPRA